MKHPLEFDTAITILAAVLIVAIGALWYGFRSTDQLYSEPMPTNVATPTSPVASPSNATATILSENDALNIVANLPDVKQWLALFTGPNQTSPTTGGAPVIGIDSETTSTYIVHAYESMSDHDATFNWYTVNKQTGSTTVEF